MDLTGNFRNLMDPGREAGDKVKETMGILSRYQFRIQGKNRMNSKKETH